MPEPRSTPARSALVVVCSTASIDTVVTDVGAPEDAVAELTAAGVPVIRA